MKKDKSILIAFLLNFFFSIFEVVGGLFTNSVSILSDAFHDLSDALSIGISYILERKSSKKPDDIYTYGYKRYSILGAFITTAILLSGSILMVYHSVNRLFSQVEINYDGMIIIAVVGFFVNFIAAYLTKKGESLNQKAVNLHMIEDVLGWLIVLIGSVIIKITNLLWIDSILSIIVSVYIFIHAISHLNEILDLFLLKIPKDIDIEELKKHILDIKGIKNIHHIHIWSLDGINNFATLHVVTDEKVKEKIRDEMKEHGINNVTIEIENTKEECKNKKCNIEENTKHHHHHHH